LVVELDQLVSGVVGDLGAEEVVQKAGRSLRAHGPDRAEREVRGARVDDHLQRRPDEVELAGGVALAVAAPLSELAEQAVRRLQAGRGGSRVRPRGATPV